MSIVRKCDLCGFCDDKDFTILKICDCIQPLEYDKHVQIDVCKRCGDRIKSCIDYLRRGEQE